MIEYIIVGACAFGVGWWVREHTLVMNLLRNPEAVIRMMQDITKLRSEYEEAKTNATSGIELEVEHSQGQVYAWVKTTHQFIGQGSTVEEIIIKAKEKFPHCKFWYKNPEENSQSA